MTDHADEDKGYRMKASLLPGKYYVAMYRRRRQLNILWCALFGLRNSYLVEAYEAPKGQNGIDYNSPVFVFTTECEFEADCAFHSAERKGIPWRA